MIFRGVDIEPILTAAVERAGYQPWLVSPLLNSMVLHLMTIHDLTPERVSALAEEMLPGVVQTAVEEAVAQMPPTSESLH